MNLISLRLRRGLSAALLSAFATLAGFAATTPEQDVADLKALEAAWNDAIVRKDLGFLRDRLADDFVFISAAGQVVRKDGLVAMVANPEVTVKPFFTEEVEVRLYGDTAIMTGRFKQDGTYKGQPFSVNMRYTDAYIRRDGRWIPVTAHAVLLPAPKPAN